MRRSCFLAMAFAVGCVASAWAQEGQGNLLTNAGLEELTPEGQLVGWAPEPWSRDEGAASLELVTTGAHGGGQAAKLTHTGELDWCFLHEGRIAVQPQDIMRISGWARAEESEGGAELSTTLRSADGETMEWVFGAQRIPKSDEWQHTSGRFVVPAGGATLEFRITGARPCTVYVDDLSLERLGNVADLRSPDAQATYELEQPRLSVSFDGPRAVCSAFHSSDR